MKNLKQILALFCTLVLCVGSAEVQAQTFNVQNLDVLGTATVNSLPQYGLVVGGGASNALSTIGTGTSGQILQSNGPTANPAFISPSTLGVLPSVSSLSALRTQLSSTVTTVNVTGYYATSDGGGGIYTYVPTDTTSGAYFTGSISGTVLTVSAITNGTLAVGQRISGNGFSAPLYISSLGTGTGGTGTYNLSASATVASETMEADYGGGTIVAGDGARWKILQSYPITALQTGAKGDGVTDDYWELNAALLYTPNVAVLPAKAYRISQGLTVPQGKALKGQTFGAYVSGAISDSAPLIMADLAVPTILSVVGGGITEGPALENVMVNRAAGTVPAGSVGISVTNSNNNITVQDVMSQRSAIGISVGAGTFTSLGIHLNRVYTGQITQYHIQISNAVEVTVDNSRFGRNGGADVNSTAYVNINGNTVDTVRFVTDQFNQSGGSAGALLSFTGYAADPNGIITFQSCHAEGWGAVVTADAGSSAIRRLRFIGNSINGTGALYAGGAGKLQEFMLVGNTFDGGISLTLDQQTQSVVTGNIISGAVIINQGSQVVTGNFFTSTVLLEGTSVQTVFVGNVTQGITNTMTGSATIANNL